MNRVLEICFSLSAVMSGATVVVAHTAAGQWFGVSCLIERSSLAALLSQWNQRQPDTGVCLEGDK